jgi:hypothetical protein
MMSLGNIPMTPEDKDRVEYLADIAVETGQPQRGTVGGYDVVVATEAWMLADEYFKTQVGYPAMMDQNGIKTYVIRMPGQYGHGNKMRKMFGE